MLSFAHSDDFPEAFMRSSRHVITTALIAFVLTPVLAAQAIDPEFRKAREARTTAIRTGDQATFDRLTADNFTATGPTGVIENRTQRVGRATRPIVDSGSPEEEKITAYGDDTVVLTWRQGATRFLEIWVKERGAWKVAAVQLTPIQKP